jgi:uncharacterized protein YkwD
VREAARVVAGAGIAQAMGTMSLIARCRTVALVLPIALVSVPPSWVAPRAEGLAAVAPVQRASSLVELANLQRDKAGLRPLRPNTQLMKAAQTQAEQGASVRRLAHVLPEARYPRPQDRLEASGYPWRAFAENIAYGQSDPTSATEAWMKSPDHRKNLLNPTYTELGTGYALDDSGRPYYVQVFGRPL